MEYKNITELRTIAKREGVKDVNMKNEAELIKAIKECKVSNDDIQDVYLHKSEDLQQRGWEVFAIYIDEENKLKHKLRFING